MTEVEQLTAALVAIPSVNPALDPSGAGESEIARYVLAWASERGLETTWLESVSGRPSVLIRARGRGHGPTVLLNAHLDTVGVTGMDAPFEPRVHDGRMYGRGTMDMKASLAACLLVAAEAARNDLAGDVVVAAVADEEHDSIGTRETLESLDVTDDVALAIVTEPTDLTLHVAHRGFVVVEVELEGRASHTSQPERGVNALTHLGRLLCLVEDADARLRSAGAHPLLGHGSWQAVLAHGGHELFTTPAAARVSLERRTLPGESAGAVADEVNALLDGMRQEDPRVRASVATIVAREAFAAAANDRAVEAMEAAAASVSGGLPERVGAPYWTDAALVAEAGIPTVLFGPVGGGIHQPGEWVDLASVESVRRSLAQLVRDLCA